MGNLVVFAYEEIPGFFLKCLMPTNIAHMDEIAILSESCQMLFQQDKSPIVTKVKQSNLNSLSGTYNMFISCAEIWLPKTSDCCAPKTRRGRRTPR